MTVGDRRQSGEALEASWVPTNRSAIQRRSLQRRVSPWQQTVSQVTVDRVNVGETQVGKVIVLYDITDRALAEYALRTGREACGNRKARTRHRPRDQ